MVGLLRRVPGTEKFLDSICGSLDGKVLFLLTKPSICIQATGMMWCYLDLASPFYKEEATGYRRGKDTCFRLPGG